MTNATPKTWLCRPLLVLSLWTVCTLCAVCTLAAPALAQDLEQPERDQGVSNVAAVMGHGGLTAGFSPEGELTLLRWPSPGYMDQLEYETAKTADARSLPRFGARDNAGAFVGLYTEPGGLSWLSGAGWTRTMMYRADESLVLITTYRNSSLGITVTGTDAIAPSGGTGAHDVLARRFDVEVDQNRAYTVLRLVAFANFAPAITPVPGAPEAEVSGDAERDYACLYSERARALVDPVHETELQRREPEADDEVRRQDRGDHLRGDVGQQRARAEQHDGAPDGLPQRAAPPGDTGPQNGGRRDQVVHGGDGKVPAAGAVSTHYARGGLPE